MEVGTCGDRQLVLAALRKQFVASLKASKSGRNNSSSCFPPAGDVATTGVGCNGNDQQQLLALFTKAMNHFTPEELCLQFKEYLLFTAQIAEELVQEIRRRAGSDNTREAARAVYSFLRAEPPDSRGWQLLTAVIFISNSGAPKVFECLCKTLLPNTLIKVSYLFMDLPETDDPEEAAHRRRLYDSLVMLLMNLCAQPQVAEELIQKDDLFLLFIGASSRSPSPANIWRNANFTFLCSLVAKALTPPVLKYIHSKRCIAHYLANIGTVDDQEEQSVLLCNLLDLLRSSADNSQRLVDDFGTANGFHFIVEFCTRGSLKNAEQVLSALTNLISSGDHTVHFQIPQQNATAHFHSQKLAPAVALSAGTVRCMAGFKVLEQCFVEGQDPLCLLALEKIGQLFRAERMNYFIVDESSSLFLVTEAMMAKGVAVQEKVLELVETVLRTLNYVPYKEIASLNLHLKNSVAAADWETMGHLLHFFLKIISINATLRDAFRELLILETFLHIVQNFSFSPADCISPSASAVPSSQCNRVVQLCMDLLLNATKGNVLNAQFITENMDVRIVKTLMLGQSLEEEGNDAQQQVQELRTSIALLVKQLLYLAKNEQLFSSILQLLFSEPENLELCTVILKLFTSVLLESHKVRIMFRRSGGYICLMTLLLHLEGLLAVDAGHQRTTTTTTTLSYIALIFHVLTISMRFEPSNAKYFQSEVRPSMVNSILRNLGCFSSRTKVYARQPVWGTFSLETCDPKLWAIHECFRLGPADIEEHRKWFEKLEFATGMQSDFELLVQQQQSRDSCQIPADIFSALFILRLLFDLAIDLYEKPSNDLRWAAADELLRNQENLETVPPVSWDGSTVLAHPGPVLSILQLLPSIGGCSPSIDGQGEENGMAMGEEASGDQPSQANMTTTIGALDQWAASAQLYAALLLKAILRVERNQQVMCQFDMPAKVLDVGEELFKLESHPLLFSFHYFFERLAYQSLHPSELRHFLRLDQPLCCTNLDDDDDVLKADETSDRRKPGGPIPIHRIKAFVSMLAPRNHASVHCPGFVEFDMAIEGFCSLLVPSLSRGPRPPNGGGHQQSPVAAEGQSNFFNPTAGFTLAMWFCIADFSPTAAKGSPICLFSIVRALEATEAGSQFYGHQLAASIENHQTCFQVLLQRIDFCWTLTISAAEHSVADELRKDFGRAPELCLQVPLSEQFFPPLQWAHLAIVISRPASLLKASGTAGVEVFVNGRSLASQKLAFPWLGGESAAGGQQPALHAYIGTLPFFRRPSQLRWRLASLYLIEEAVAVEVVRKMVALGAAYLGNLQSSSPADTSPLVAEKKIILSLNTAATSETNAQMLRSMTATRTDVELVATLLGISPNDQSTPLRMLWNMAALNGMSQRSVPLGAVLVGYLGIRTFVPCPVSALLDSMGGLLPLFGLVAMSSDSSGLYASLKVLVSAMHTNDSIAGDMRRQRGFQTLAILLEEKAPLMNSHIVHLVLTLAGTVDDGSREHLSIPCLQTFEDLLCDLDVWKEAPDEVWKLLMEHFFELIVEGSEGENLRTIRQSALLPRLFIYLIENRTLFPIRNDIAFLLVGAIVQFPCEDQSLLRLGQTISATVAFDMDETGYPFHIAELEKLLLLQKQNAIVNDIEGKQEANEEVKEAQLYAVYVRNRLLNILCTMLANSNAQMNSQLSAMVVKVLGFGWILALCGPRVHKGTLFMAVRILTNLLRYPQLVDKFRGGSANGGWLSDADSVIRNRAAVLLGFSVANQAGAVGDHVDINPELDKCSGFASLEHVAYAHADKPLVYLALLAVLFQQQRVNVQPLEDFTVEAIWSNVFALDEQSSVVDAIERSQFCADAVVSLLATIRAALHKQFELGNAVNEDPKHWATNYPLRLLQLFTFLYQNSAQFFAICHTEAFVVALFSSLLPPNSATPQTPVSAKAPAESLPWTAEGQEAESDGNGVAADSMAPANRCVRQCLELLTNILLNDLCLANESRTEPLFDAIIEFMDCGGGGPVGHSKQGQLFTELVNACLDHFMASKMFFSSTANAAPLIVPPNARSRLNQSSEQTSTNVVRFLSRVIDTVWNCLYKGNPIRILKCFLKLLAETHASNKAAAQLQCTDAHVASLFRLILYLLSRPIDNVDTQMSVLDTLAEIVRNQHLFLTPKSTVDPLFYAALVHLVFMLSDRPQFDLQDPRNRQLERGTAQVSMCAQSVWGILWQQKKAALEDWFRKGELDLDLFSVRAKCDTEANKAWLQFVDSQTDGSYSLLHQDSSSSGRLLAAQKMLPQQLQTRLSRVVARSGIRRLRKSATEGGGGNSVDAGQQQWLAPLLRFDDERLRVEPETFYMWIRVHISLLRELVRSQCQRYHEWHAHVRKWCMQEWHSAEAELTRERGLWGPDRGSRLDKFQLDVTEGPCRIRRKLVPNPAFYLHYPYRPHLDAPEAKPLRAKVAISFDSKLFYERMAAKRVETMDERGIVDWQIGQMLPPNPVAVDQQQLAAIESSAELNMSMIRRMVQKNLELNERQKLTAKAENSTSIEEEAAIEEEEEEEEEETEAADEDTKVEEESAAGNVREQRGRSRTTRSASAGASVEEGPKSGEEAEQQRQRTQPQQDQQQPPKKRRDFSVGVAETAGQGPDNQTLLRLLEQGEQLHSMFRCARVQGLDTMEGLLLFGKDHFYVVDGFTLLKTREIRDLDFLPEQFHDPIIPYIAMGCQSRPQSTKTNRQCNKFAYDDIKEVHKRRYLLQQIALEVFSADGRNFLLAFPRKVRDRVYQKLLTMAKRASSEVAQFMKEQKRLRPTDTGGGMAGGPIAVAAGSQLLSQLLQAGGHGQQQSITHKWQRGELSNFDYLMALNTLAGRSYNDLSQYPVFPWVLADYDTEHLDLTKASSFRDLSKPMGAQSPERLADFLKRYREWDDPGGTPPYMYGTHYSSAMIVLSYLVRLEPFTQQFLKLQGGHFDLADRMFHSVRDAYWSAARNNMADVKELIPEFFYLPELLLNANRFDFGVKQSGQRVNHVQVPRWAHGDVHEFVRLHRQALECDYVSEHLHEWIDLIFGYKQTGDPAREAHNVFHHLFYETSVDVEAIEDPLQRNATLGFINNFGQIPAQLFKKPHPQRKVQPTPQGQQQLAAANVSAAGLCQVVPGVHTARLFYHAPEQLRASPRPVKELRTAVGEIFVNEKGSQVVVLEQNRVFIAPGSFLAWGFHDRSVRFGTVGQDKSTVSLLETNDVYEITCMASTDGRQVFAGLSTGTILVWSLLSTSSASSSTSTNRQTQTPRLVPKKTLVGHSDVITALAASGAHNLLVSGSRDRTAILWHLSRLEFIRQLPGPHPGPVTAVAINEAKGDIATASGPWLFLWTVNGIPLAVVNTLLDSGIFSNASSLCLCLGFSTANDWDPNNIILCGTSDGLVKMYSCERMAQHPNAEHQQQPQLSPNSSCPSPAASDGLAIRDHLLRRSQRIQQHHSHHYSQPPLSSSSRSARQPKSSDSQASVESQASSPMHGGTPASSVASSSFSRQSSAQQPKTPTQQHHQQQAQAVPPGMEAVQWIRTLRLRRILSEHTAFAAGNAQPAPITAVRPTKDHRSLLVGDGIGRIWMWTIGAGDPASSSETH